MSLTTTRPSVETTHRIDPAEAHDGVWFAVLEDGTRVHALNGVTVVMTDDGVQQVVDRPVLHRCVVGQTLMLSGLPLGDARVARIQRMEAR